MTDILPRNTKKIYCNILVAAVIIAVTVLYASRQPKIPAENYALDENSSASAAVSLHNDFSDPKCGAGVDSAAVRQKIIDGIYNGISPWDDFPPAHLNGILQPEHSFMLGSSDAVFEHLIAETRPETIIEVGTYLGNSAIHMGGLVRRIGLKTQIICVDDFRAWLASGLLLKYRSQQIVNGDRLHLYKFMLNVLDANLTDSVMFLPFSTSNGLELLCEMGIYGDLVEIDAGHSFHSVWLDINTGYKVLRPGGVLFGHDIHLPGVRDAVNLFAGIHGFKIRIEGQHWILY